MTEPQAYEALTQRWIDIWPGLQPDTPYTFRGETFDAVATWARVTFVRTGRVQATMGSSARYEDRGLIRVDLFADIDGGAAPLAELRQSVIDTYETLDLSGLLTFAAQPAGAPIDEGRWLIDTVTIPYWFDEQR